MTMRLILAVLILAVAMPEAEASGNKAQCKNRCDSSYQFCLARAGTKQARKACRVDRKLCKSGCK